MEWQAVSPPRCNGLPSPSVPHVRRPGCLFRLPVPYLWPEAYIRQAPSWQHVMGTSSWHEQLTQRSAAWQVHVWCVWQHVAVVPWYVMEVNALHGARPLSSERPHAAAKTLQTEHDTVAYRSSAPYHNDVQNASCIPVRRGSGAGKNPGENPKVITQRKHLVFARNMAPVTVAPVRSTAAMNASDERPVV